LFSLNRSVLSGQLRLRVERYDLSYSEPFGGHDYALWRGTLGDVLARMLSPGDLTRPRPESA
jgi:enterochelin esterase-like enzyme